MGIPNKHRGKTSQHKPTKTDQSGARDTDLNIIVRQLVQGGTIRGTTKEPMYGDFTELAGDLRDLIERARQMEKLRGTLPDALQALSITDLVEMDPAALNHLLKPKEQPKEEPKP